MNATTDDYRIETKHDAWDHNDPLPWAWAVLSRDTVIQRGWAGDEAEAREFAQEWLDRYVTGDWDFAA